MGSSQTTPVNVRVLAATHRDLEALVRVGRFRDDLHYRINVVTISLPPFRDRREDLTLLIDHFRTSFAAKNGKSVRGLNRGARETRATELLGISERVLRYKLKKYGLAGDD